MTRFLARRLVYVAATMLVASVILFLLFELSRGRWP